MAMITCKACGKKYRDSVKECPECGEPKPGTFWKSMKGPISLILIGAGLFLIWKYVIANGYWEQLVNMLIGP